MTRPRIYPNQAARQKAYMDRLRAARPVIKQVTRRPHRQSRPVRLETVEEELRNLAEEYQQWLEALPANLTESDLALRLAEVVERLEALADEVADLDPPRGFGR